MTSSRSPAQLSALLDALHVYRKKLPHLADQGEPVGTYTAAGLALKAGLDERTATRIASVVAELDESLRRAVMEPIRATVDGTLMWGNFHVRQPDQTSCVPTSLAVQAAHGNIAIALWLVTGIDVIGIAAQVTRSRGRGPVAEGQPLMEGEPHGDRDAIAERFEALVRWFQLRATHRGWLRVWPRRCGVPPWGAARWARHGELRFTSRLVNDLSLDSVRRVVGAAIVAATRGVPSLLYTGGDSSTRYRDAMPRHAVLLHVIGERNDPAAWRDLDRQVEVADARPNNDHADVAFTDDPVLATFEPSSGRIVPIAPEEMVRGGVVRAAYGGWSHIAWAVIPRSSSQ